MSVLGESINTKRDVQVWNNAVFDNGCNSEINQIKSPSFDSFDSRKENQSPVGLSDSSVFVENQLKPFKNLDVKSLLKPGVGGKTDEEIEIENEIRRLVAKLEAIRRDKTEDVKKRDSGVKKIGKTRGFSLGPNEIMSAKTKQMGGTPVQSGAQSRRKSCFWKLEDIEEEKFGFSRGKNLSSKQAVTTGGAKKRVSKKDELLRDLIQPKKLFGEQSVPAKKPLKPGRVIASRYNQAATENSLVNKRVKKKWEIPSEVKRLDLDENKVCVGTVDKVVLPKIRAVRCVDDSGRDSGPAKRVAELVGKRKSYFHDDDDQEVEETVCQILSFE